MKKGYCKPTIVRLDFRQEERLAGGCDVSSGHHHRRHHHGGGKKPNTGSGNCNGNGFGNIS